MTGPDSVAEESRRQLISAWSSIARDVDPAADLRELPGIRMMWAESRMMLWRSATLTETGINAEQLARRLGEAVETLTAKSRPGLLWVFEDMLDVDARVALPSAARDAKLEIAFSVVGQAGDILPLPDPHHPELTFERVRTAEQLRTFADLNAVPNGASIEDLYDGIGRWVGPWTTRFHAYLALRDGVPVSTAAGVACDGRLFLTAVCTAAGHERRGYAEAVSRKALHEGGLATGLRRATLHATTGGARLYPRIGFVPNSLVRVYATS